MFNLIPEDWRGSVTPWVAEITKLFRRLKALHFRRMIVRDSDLELPAIRRGKVLQVLKLDKCSGFSTDGLLHIAHSCRYTDEFESTHIIGERKIKKAVELFDKATEQVK
ncbi:hypothetical protein FXO37_10145, partial [Capsicum annuum]